MAAVVPLPSSSHARPIQISLDTSLSSCGGTNCRLHKISSRLWLTLHDSSCCSDFQIFRGNIIVCAQNNGFSGCFDTTLCFPNSLVVSSADELRTQSAQSPSEKHLALSLQVFARLRPFREPYYPYGSPLSFKDPFKEPLGYDGVGWKPMPRS